MVVRRSQFLANCCLLTSNKELSFFNPFAHVGTNYRLAYLSPLPAQPLQILLRINMADSSSSWAFAYAPWGIVYCPA